MSGCWGIGARRNLIDRCARDSRPMGLDVREMGPWLGDEVRPRELWLAGNGDGGRGLHAPNCRAFTGEKCRGRLFWPRATSRPPVSLPPAAPRLSDANALRQVQLVAVARLRRFDSWLPLWIWRAALLFSRHLGQAENHQSASPWP